jgi:hypothetical protein
MGYRLFLLVAIVALGASCVDKKKPKNSEKVEPVTAPVEVSANQPVDASVAAESGASGALPEAPLTGTHLDSAVSTYRPSAAYQPRPPLPRKATGKTIELVLRSTPSGAIASIDGKAIGSTPTFWQGIADGHPHEYTFTKEGYSMARYRFVAIQSGVVHSSLSALVINDESEEAPGEAP